MPAEAVQTVADKTQVIAALRQASIETGSDFHYLLGTAIRESGLKSQAQATTSSAQGLFQFTGQTWLGMIKESGAKYGLGAYAAEIEKDADGHYQADNSADRSAILALRKDPKIAALMAGEFSNKCKASLEQTLGRGVCDGELYAAHFLGANAAAKLIQTNASAPQTHAAELFPQAAGANRNVFYHADGSSKTVREVYEWALKQPNGNAPVETTRVATAELRTNTTAAAAEPDNALITIVLAWTPERPSFSALDDDDATDGAMPVKPFLLTPGVMDLLSQVSPSHR
jgi:hypothetical protein